MKKIDFGREESNNPKGGFEKIGTDDGILQGQIAEFINIEGNTYLISKIDSTFKNSAYQVGDYYVKEAITDLYADGSATLFLNSGNEEMCRAIQGRLNSGEIKRLINDGMPISEIFKSELAPRSFMFLTIFESQVPIIATEINEDIFETKKKLINNCHESISSMRETIENMYKKENIR